MQIRKREVRRYRFGFRVVSRVLYRREIVNFVLARYNYDAAGVLSRRALDADAAEKQSLDFGAAERNALLFKIFHNETVRRLFGERAERSGSENVFRAEKFFGVFMYFALNVAREVKVYIRRFVAFETKEGLKRDTVTVGVHKRSAVVAVLVRQVKARAVLAVCEEYRLMAFRAYVVRIERIDLGYARKVCNERRADRATRADEIAVVLAEFDEFLSYHIKHGVAVADYRVKFAFETFFNDLGQGFTVNSVRLFVAKSR